MCEFWFYWIWRNDAAEILVWIVVSLHVLHRTLDSADVQSYSYRPIFNLSVLSKLLKRLVHQQMLDYLNRHRILYHTVCLPTASFNRHVGVTGAGSIIYTLLILVICPVHSRLALLDLLAPFDTVGHDILLQRLQKFRRRSVSNSVMPATGFGLIWQVEFSASAAAHQGSVLGPLLFILYTADLITLIEGFGFRPHAYADDTQKSRVPALSCRHDSVNQLQLNLSACLALAVAGMSDCQRLFTLRLCVLRIMPKSQ